MLSRSTIVDLVSCMQNINYILYNYYWHTGQLASPNEPDGTDHTGEIISFSDVGSGVGTDPRAWYCYTYDTSGIVWQFPDGSGLPIVFTGMQLGMNCSSVLLLILPLFCIVVPHTSVLMENTAV